tara:strand:+ start:4012 stop:4434 length:423 start_codon:yes stop_codon:yes gene_type:complete
MPRNRVIVVDAGETAKHITKKVYRISRNIVQSLFYLADLDVAKLIRWKTRTIKDANDDYIYKPNYEQFKKNKNKDKDKPVIEEESYNLIDDLRNMGKDCYQKIRKKKGGFRTRKLMRKKTTKKIYNNRNGKRKNKEKSKK